MDGYADDLAAVIEALTCTTPRWWATPLAAGRSRGTSYGTAPAGWPRPSCFRTAKLPLEVPRFPRGSSTSSGSGACQAGLRGAYDSIKAFSETDFSDDLRQIDVPALVAHGEDDQIVPVHDSARKSARLIKGAQEIYYPGAPHGLTATHADQFNADLLAFLRS